MSAEVPAIDFWAAHPKNHRKGELCCSPVFSYLVERDACTQDRKCARRDYGTSWSCGIWALHPKLTRKEPGCFSTLAARLIWLCHPSYRPSVHTSSPSALQSSPKPDQPEVLISEADLEWVGKVSKLYLTSWLAKGPITYDEYRKLKFELMHEMHEMVRKGMLTLTKYTTCRVDAWSFEISLFFRQRLISSGDYEALKSNLRQFALEHTRENGCISTADFEVLQSDLRKFELDRMLEKRSISLGDYKVLNANLNTFEAENAFEKKAITAGDYGKLQEDLQKVAGA